MGPGSPAADLPLVEFADRAAWESWLKDNHDDSPGLWLKLAKKGAPRETVSQAEAIEQKTGEARAWAGANPHQFGSLRSIETLHGVAGWRTGGPSLRTLTGWTWDRVKETLKTMGASGYIRIKEEVNKQNLISDRESIGPEKLREIGLRVVQEEIFYVEPNFTALPASAARA